MNINIEILKRNIKLHQLGIDALGDVDKRIFNYLNTYMNNLYVYKSLDSPDITLFGKDKDIVVSYDELHNFFTIHNVILWKLLRNMMYSDIQELIRWWIIDIIKLDMTINHIL